MKTPVHPAPLPAYLRQAQAGSKAEKKDRFKSTIFFFPNNFNKIVKLNKTKYGI